MNKTILTIASLVAACAAHAQIVGVTGSAVNSPAPASVVPNVTESNTNTLVFFEGSSILASVLDVDAINPGTYTSAQNLSIAAGTSISTYYLHSDRVNTSPTQSYAGSVTFAQRIIGVIGRSARLDSSDFLGNPMTTYGTGDVDRQWEFANGEQFTISGDGLTLTYQSTLNTSADQLRIVTEAVPEPATMTVLAGAAALAALRKRKQK